MDKLFFRQLLLLVNNKDQMEILNSYCEARINILRGFLETTKEYEKIREIQGAIAELKRFSTLRDEAIKGAET